MATEDPRQPPSQGSNGDEAEPRPESVAPSPAEACFAAWLEEEPKPTRQQFERLRARHPQLARELDRLWRGLEAYERVLAQCKKVLASESRRRPRLLHRTRVAVAATALLCATLFGFVKVREQVETAHQLVCLASELEQQVHEFDGNVQRHAADFDPNAILHPPVSRGTPDDESMLAKLKTWSRRFDETAQLMKWAEELGNSVLARRLVRSSDRAMASRIVGDIEGKLREVVRTDANPRTRVLRESLARADRPSFVRSPELHALARSAVVRAARAHRGVVAALPAELAHLLDLADKPASLRLRVIDLDHGGAEANDASVWIQEATFPTNELGKAVRVGAAPWNGTLAAGDWRLTVLDNKTQRFSELRVLSLPGEDLGLRVAFLRATDDVTKGMARKPAATFEYGEPRDSNSGHPFEPMSCDVGELWIDPYEVTKERWTAFYRDVSAHPEWFDGIVPVTRPSFLVGNDECPETMRKHPITNISWDEAVLFANWEGKRLPTDHEWERITKGPEGRVYPWGDDFIDDAVDASHSQLAALEAAKGGGVKLPEPDVDSFDSSVDDPRFSAGATPDGDGDPVYRLGDNVSEMTEELAVFRQADGSFAYDSFSFLCRVTRGSCFYFAGDEDSKNHKRSASVLDRCQFDGTLGFRCVKVRPPTFSE